MVNRIFCTPLVIMLIEINIRAIRTVPGYIILFTCLPHSWNDTYHIRGASTIKLKKANKKRTVTVRRVIIFLNISRHPLLICLHCCLQCCGSGSGIRDWVLFDPWIRDPGWEKVSIRIRDPGSEMNNPDHIFL